MNGLQTRLDAFQGMTNLRGHPLGWLPRDMLLGLDCQRHEFELGKRSYLAGVWRHGGWPWYYAACILWKTPIGFLLLIPLRLIARVKSDARSEGRELRLLLGPGLIILVLVSSQVGFGHHFRYVFPCLPFVYIYAAGCLSATQPCWVRRAAIVSLGCGLVGGLTSWPLSHSYFNQLARWTFADPPLLESNLDWGEDLALAEDWMTKHPEARPAYHAVAADDLARRMPLDWQPAPARWTAGWYVVSVQRLLDPQDRCAALRDQVPAWTLGDSLRIYRLGNDGSAQ
jgi:hypothetical protein